MGRRLTRDEARQLTRRRLLDAASTCFAERGFHGTTVEAIVSTCHYSRGAFYSNFDSLGELFLALLEERIEREATEVADLLRESRSGEHLIQLLHERLVTSPADPGWWMLLAEFRLHAMRDADLRPRLAEREQRLRSLYRKAIEHLIEVSGVDADLDKDLLALIVQVLEDGFAYDKRLEPDVVPPGRFLDALKLLIEAMMALGAPSRAGMPSPGS
jgi:AcrR family transcriptional regulator